MRRLVVPDEAYGLFADESAELARLDAERKERLAHEHERRRSTTGNALGCALGAGLLLFLICAAAFGIMTALEWSSVNKPTPQALTTAERERALDALDTRIAELEDRTQRTADAAAGSSPIPGPAVTSTPSYNGPLSRAVSPPDGVPTMAPERDGVGGRTRGAR